MEGLEQTIACRCLCPLKVGPEDVGQVGVLLVASEVLLPGRLMADWALGFGDARAFQLAENALPAAHDVTDPRRP